MARATKATKTAKPAASKTAEAKTAKSAASKAAEVKTAEAPEAVSVPEKTTDKKASAKRTKTTVCVEMNGLNVDIADIQTAVKNAVKEKGLTAADLKVYINAAEQTAYYTVDGVGNDEYKINLKSL